MRDIDIDFSQIDKWLILYSKAKSECTKKKYRNLIVVTCMPLVKQIAYGIARRNTDPIEDLMQVGCIGLIKAVSSVDVNKKASFKAYAIRFITGEMRHYIRDKSLMIKPPRKIQELAFRIYQVTEELVKENGKKPTDVEIAERLQLKVEQVDAGMEVERRSQVLSLDYNGSIMDDEESLPLYDKIPDEKEQLNQDIYEVRSFLKVAIDKLRPDLKQLVNLYYYECVSQGMIAKELNMSNMQVSRKMKEAHIALYNIIKQMEEQGTDD